MKPKMFIADIAVDKDKKTIIFATVKAKTLARVKVQSAKVIMREVQSIPDNDFGVSVNITIRNEHDEWVDTEEFFVNVKDKIFIVEV